VAFLKRKAGMAHADFVAYYESRHAPLILSIAPQIVGYRRNYLCEQGAIVVVNADGSSPTTVVAFGGVRTHPGGEISWSPTQDVIAFATQDGVLSVVNADGSGMHTIDVPVPGFVFGPEWSPDGLWILVSINAGHIFFNNLCAFRSTECSSDSFREWTQHSGFEPVESSGQSAENMRLLSVVKKRIKDRNGEQS
jgi:hypothetical protein